jgi:hypothetical protein
MDPQRFYDATLAPAEHFAEAISRCRCDPPSQDAELLTGRFSFGRFEKYPHSKWPSTHVHTPETNPQTSPDGSDWGTAQQPPDHAVSFRHSGWLRIRRLVRQALISLDTPSRPLHRFDACGSDPWVVVDAEDSSRLAIHSNHCHSRWCTPCSRERAARIVGNLKTRLNDGDIRFLTLTMKHTDAPLSDQIDRIYEMFRKLRRAPFWTSAVDGGCAILELVHSHRTGLWHVHLHCLLDGRYIRKEDLRAEWWRITGDSHVIDVRRCHDADHAAHYVVKYITKPVPASVINKPEQLLEMMTAVARRRLVLTWGTWRGIRLTEPLDLTAWKAIAPLSELYQRKEAGDLDAYIILSHLEDILPEAKILAGRSPPASVEDPIGMLF